MKMSINILHLLLYEHEPKSEVVIIVKVESLYLSVHVYIYYCTTYIA